MIKSLLEIVPSIISLAAAVIAAKAGRSAHVAAKLIRRDTKRND